ncbi:hypothetical protein ElyMa_002483800 [Elysia marginata]|uniref:Uncharacterized protein n=1 Tax=Elysia marginata TaxID=1093978 RepID=A0AAV4GR57_9GAST|nr:hypothetical protein ElyMa_002483800 [Elysia marginata]
MSTCLGRDEVHVQQDLEQISSNLSYQIQTEEVVDAAEQLPKAFLYNGNSLTSECYIGELSTQCAHNHAYRFTKEPSGLCGGKGKVDLQPFPKTPPELESLLSRDSALPTHFLDNIRVYNTLDVNGIQVC